jgi:hypothetical protein
MIIDADTLDYLVKLAQLIGIPVGIALYGINKRKERLEREYGTYNALDEKYIDYLTLCVSHPYLDVADIPHAQPKELNPEQRHLELVMFSILISILERAYLMYQDKSGGVRKAQWKGWDSYVRDWCRRKNFAAAVPLLKQQFDENFCLYLEEIVASTKANAS